MNQLFEKPFTFDRVIRIVFSIFLIIGIFYLITVLKNALLPFLIAWLLAYISQPFVKFIQYKMKIKNRLLSIIAFFIFTLILLFLLFITVVPSITEEINRTVDLLQTQNLKKGYIPLIPDSWIEYINSLDIREIAKMLDRENIMNAIKQIAPQVWALLSSTFSVLFSVTIIFIILLYYIFILLDYEKIANGWIGLIPDKYRPFVNTLMDDIEVTMNRYFRGQSLIALCVGILLAIGFKIIDFPLAIILGLFIGLLNMIPYLQTIGIIPMVILSLLRSAESGENFWIIFGLSLLVLGIVQCIQDLYLTPRIMGKAMGLNPAIILLSLSIWGILLRGFPKWKGIRE